MPRGAACDQGPDDETDGTQAARWHRLPRGRKLLQHYLDGHVDGAQAQRIAAHLEDCRRCGLEAETYERIKASLASQRHEVPAESIERLREFAARLVRGEEPHQP